MLHVKTSVLVETGHGVLIFMVLLGRRKKKKEKSRLLFLNEF